MLNPDNLPNTIEEITFSDLTLREFKASRFLSFQLAGFSFSFTDPDTKMPYSFDFQREPPRVDRIVLTTSNVLGESKHYLDNLTRAIRKRTGGYLAIPPSGEGIIFHCMEYELDPEDFEQDVNLETPDELYTTILLTTKQADLEDDLTSGCPKRADEFLRRFPHREFRVLAMITMNSDKWIKSYEENNPQWKQNFLGRFFKPMYAPIPGTKEDMISLIDYLLEEGFNIPESVDRLTLRCISKLELLESGLPYETATISKTYAI